MLVNTTFGSTNEQADAIALDVAKRVEIRAATIICPNGHDTEDTLQGSIMVFAQTATHYAIENHGVCCAEYYELLKAI